MRGTVTTRELALALCVTKQAVRLRGERERWIMIERGGAVLWVENKLPPDTLIAVRQYRLGKIRSSIPQNDNQIVGVTYKSASEKDRVTANLRGNLLAAQRQSGLNAADFIASYNNGVVESGLYKRLGYVALSTFYLWLKGYKESGLDGIIPRYGMKVTSGAGASLTETEKSYLEHFWLRDTRPTVEHALLLLRANVPYTRCTYNTARRYLNALPKPYIDFYRLGKTAFINRHQPFMVQDYSKYNSLDVVVSDHHCLDCVCLYKGKLIRPWITTFQDLRSGKILGWCMSVKPSSFSIIWAYYMMVIQYGIPRKAIFDNGKDYRSEILNGKRDNVTVYEPGKLPREEEIHIQGLFYLIGTEIHFTQPYNGKSKARQERFFGILKEYVSKDSGSYIGGDVTERPETTMLFFRAINGRAKRNDLPDWNDLGGMLTNMIPFINDTFKSNGVGMNNKTRSVVFNENLPSDVRHVDREALALALTKGSVRKVKGNIVSISGIDYYNEDLLRYSGRDVIVRQEILRDDEVMVCDTNGALLCHAVANYFKESGDLAADTKRLRIAQKYNLAQLAEFGSHEVKVDPEYETMHSIAANYCRQNEIVDVDAHIAMPMAVGAENCMPDYEAPEPPQTAEGKPKIKSLFEAKDEDWL